jgi:hypothetical protein
MHHVLEQDGPTTGQCIEEKLGFDERSVVQRSVQGGTIIPSDGRAEIVRGLLNQIIRALNFAALGTGNEGTKVSCGVQEVGATLWVLILVECVVCE